MVNDQFGSVQRESSQRTSNLIQNFKICTSQGSVYPGKGDKKTSEMVSVAQAESPIGVTAAYQPSGLEKSGSMSLSLSFCMCKQGIPNSHGYSED